MDKIYKLMGDGRMTKWLSSIYNEDSEEEVIWKRLIVFLKKDFPANKLHDNYLFFSSFFGYKQT